MPDTPNQRQRAEGRIQLAMQRLAADYLFHVTILERFTVLARIDVGTMGVVASPDGVLLFHNPAFVLELPPGELGGVLLHEVHHVLFRHIFMSPADYPDEWALTMAAEVSANEFVKEPLPEGGIFLEMFPMLPAMESTQVRYRRLRKEKSLRRKFPIAKNGYPYGIGQIGTIDDHGVWKESNGDQKQAEAAVREIIQDAVIQVGAGRVPKGLRRAVGNMIGKDQLSIHGAGRGRLDWRHLLRRYLGQVLVTRPTFARPSRRFPELLGIVAGKHRRGNRPRVLTVIDTSGSVSQTELEAISAELGRMSKHFSLVVAECDADIQNVYSYRPLQYVTGRGGTDFRPPLARSFLHKHKPDVVVYFTDGCGPAPELPPPVPVVWCLVGGGESPARWGRVVRMRGDVPVTTKNTLRV